MVFRKGGVQCGSHVLCYLYPRASFRGAKSPEVKPSSLSLMSALLLWMQGKSVLFMPRLPEAYAVWMGELKRCVRCCTACGLPHDLLYCIAPEP